MCICDTDQKKIKKEGKCFKIYASVDLSTRITAWIFSYLFNLQKVPRFQLLPQEDAEEEAV
jgi:hypothetical protein